MLRQLLGLLVLGGSLAKDGSGRGGGGRVAILSSGSSSTQWLDRDTAAFDSALERLAEAGFVPSSAQKGLLQEAVAEGSPSDSGDAVLIAFRDGFMRLRGAEASLACVDAEGWATVLYKACTAERVGCTGAEHRALQQLMRTQWCAAATAGDVVARSGNAPRALLEAGEAAKAKVRNAALAALAPEKCDATCDEFAKECEKCSTVDEIDAVAATFIAKMQDGSDVAAKPALDLDEANEALAAANATEVIRFAVKRFGERVAVTTSFGVQSALMLHLATSVKPDIPVIWIDTGYLPAETYTFAKELTARLNLNLHIFQSDYTAARMEATLGAKLWETDHHAYGRMRKVQPMAKALAALAGDPAEDMAAGECGGVEVDDDERVLSAPCVLTALRKSQTKHRGGLRTVNMQRTPRPHYKVCPVLGWSKEDVDAYLKKHKLPYHPLKAMGYSSVGDAHSSAPVSKSQGGSELAERATRFGGRAQECGLHVENVLDKVQYTRTTKGK